MLEGREGVLEGRGGVLEGRGGVLEGRGGVLEGRGGRVLTFSTATVAKDTVTSSWASALAVDTMYSACAIT